jgi:hypothetical protein
MTNQDATLVVAVVALITAIGCDPDYITEVIEEIGERGFGATPASMVGTVQDCIHVVELRHSI